MLLVREQGDGDQSVVFAADHDGAAVDRPGNRQPFSAELDSSGAGLGADVPELARAVARDGGELGFFGRVPGYALDAACVAAEFGTVFHLGLFGVPDAESAVCGARGDEVAGWGPGDCADAGLSRGSISGGFFRGVFGAFLAVK